MLIDFRADLLSFVIHKLGIFGVKPPSTDVTECSLLLLKLQRRCPEAKPRQTRFSASFNVPRDLQKGLQLLCDAIHRGDDLSPYLSRQTFNPNVSDRLLDDWGILHLHMGMKFQKNGLIEGTKIVSFVIVRDDLVYFIDALPHGKGHATVWAQENLIHIIERNWPELLPSNHSPMTPDILSPQERLNLRKKCVNASVSKQSGEVILAPGGGMMVNGAAAADFMKMQQIYTQLDYLEELCKKEEESIRAALGIPKDQLNLCANFDEKNIVVYHPASRTGINFIEPVLVNSHPFQSDSQM